MIPVLRSPFLPALRTPFDVAKAVRSGASLPVNLTPPIITGTLLVGDTLTATPGTWSNADTVAAEWFVDGVASGNTSTTYVIQLADAGLLIEYRETATNADGSVQAVASVTASINELFMVTDNGGEPFAVAEGNFLVRAA